MSYAGVAMEQAVRIGELETDALQKAHDFFNLTKQHEKLLAARELSAQVSATMRDESVAKSERIARLEGAIRKYGQHINGCQWQVFPPGSRDCSCGLHSIIGVPDYASDADCRRK